MFLNNIPRMILFFVDFFMQEIKFAKTRKGITIANRCYVASEVNKISDKD